MPSLTACKIVARSSARPMQRKGQGRHEWPGGASDGPANGFYPKTYPKVQPNPKVRRPMCRRPIGCRPNCRRPTIRCRCCCQSTGPGHSGALARAMLLDRHLHQPPAYPLSRPRWNCLLVPLATAM